MVSDVGTFGLNIPSLNCIILASNVKDSRQLVGRVRRSNPGKTCGLVIDPIDQVPILEHHAEIRRRQYLKDHHTILGG